MADEFGVPEPGNAKDYLDFLFALHDILADGVDIQANKEALTLLAQARIKFIDDFEAKHPGCGQGRALWR